MHILEIPSFFPPHGGEFCLEQSRALCSIGHEVHILACTQLALTTDKWFYMSAPRGCWWETMDGIEVYRSFLHGLPKLVLWNEQRWVKRVLEMYDVYKTQFGRPDVIHAHCTKWAGVAAQHIAQREGIPYYITEHLSSILYRKDFGHHWEMNPWAKDLIRQAMMEAHCVITVADQLVDDLRPFFGDVYRHRTISNIVDVDFFKREGGVAERGNESFRYACLARADVYGKGYDVLADAVKGDWLKLHHAQLHIAGRDTERLRRMFPQPEVVIHGNLTKEGVRDLLWQSDALVLATRCEAQPLVLLEAMCNGLPIVTTEAVPQHETIREACLIVPIGDAEALSLAMDQVQRVERKSEWVENVRELASPQSVAQQLEHLFAGD